MGCAETLLLFAYDTFCWIIYRYKGVAIMFSTHFKHSLAVIAALVALLLGDYIWLKHKIHDVIVPPQITLPKNDKELITYNENRHTITVTTSKGTVTKYSRSPSVEIRKDGTVKVDANAWGMELRPFLGIGYSDTGRAYIGCNLFYFHQFDAATSFGWTADNTKPVFQPMLSLGWNFWSNTSLSIGANPIPFILQHKPEFSVFLSVRL